MRTKGPGGTPWDRVALRSSGDTGTISEEPCSGTSPGRWAGPGRSGLPALGAHQRGAGTEGWGVGLGEGKQAPTQRASGGGGRPPGGAHPQVPALTKGPEEQQGGED